MIQRLGVVKISHYNRKGSNLIEMVLILPVLCIVLIQVSMAIRSMFHLSSIAKHRSQATLQLSRLEKSLRQDAHQSTKATLMEAQSRITGFRFEESSRNFVEYRIQKNGLTRIAMLDDGHRNIEHFELYDAMQVNVHVSPIDESDSTTIDVSLYRIVSRLASRGRLELHVESVVGRHRKDEMASRRLDSTDRSRELISEDNR